MSHTASTVNYDAERERGEAALSPVLPLVAKALCYEAGGQRLIDRVSFTLTPGPCTVLLGANGAGKSLLLRLCHGLIEPSVGVISWANQTPTRAHRWVAMVFQKPVLLRRSAAANIEYALALKGFPRRKRKKQVDEALRSAGLSAIANRSARVLSGGEQQRLAIARAWALQPQVLLLDEPTSNLDPTATHAIETMIRDIRNAGTRIIMSTHDLNQTRRLCDEILFIHKGRLLEHASAEEFFERPRSEEARAFIEGKLIY
jgi:tungstate transport system ATP-binding protein